MKLSLQTLRISGASLLFSLFIVTMFEMIFYFTAVTGIEQDITTAGIRRVTALLGRQIRQALDADDPPLAGKLSTAQKTQLLRNLEASLGEVLPRLREKAAAEQQAMNQHNAPLKRIGFRLSLMVLLVLVGSFLLFFAYSYFRGERGYAWGTTLSAFGEMGKETALLLAGFALYDFLLFYCVVRYFEPISAGDYLATVFIPFFGCQPGSVQGA